MASTVIFLEVRKWTCDYDPAIDLLVLLVHSSFRLYIFFSCLFNVPVVSWHFDPHCSYADLHLYLAHPPYFPEPAPSTSLMEIDPSKGSLPYSVLHVAELGSSSAGTEVLSKMQLEEDLEEPLLENRSCRIGFIVWARLFVMYIFMDL